jgi:hypothetical protein
MSSLDRAWCVLCALPVHKFAHGHDYGGKVEKIIRRELRYNGGCCCFRWDVYAPWMCYLALWALYTPKLPLWPLITLPDLVGVRLVVGLSLLK